MLVLIIKFRFFLSFLNFLDGITIFPEQYEQFKDLLIENNTVVLSGEVSKKENTSIIVNKVTQI